MLDNIILIGFMGSGKTSVGKLLAQKLSYEFLDTDEEIEKISNMKISKIFEDRGEEYFRDFETKLINQMLNETKQSVVSTGGGLPLRECNANILRKLGVVVYLKATKDTIVKRVKEDANRPLLSSGNLEERVESLLELRSPTYGAVAHIEISTDEKSYSAILTEIIEQYYQFCK